jgi:hypothetical protein
MRTRFVRLVGHDDSDDCGRRDDSDDGGERRLDAHDERDGRIDSEQHRIVGDHRGSDDDGS